MLNTTERVNILYQSSEILDLATIRISKVWNDRVADAIDVNFINRIVANSRTAINQISAQCDSCGIEFMTLNQLGRW